MYCKIPLSVYSLVISKLLVVVNKHVLINSKIQLKKNVFSVAQ